ncbi:hypothetical protein [Pantoea sp.]|uniref:hypothetical protein n=1 Tax=Pantoea sp. TaxID=69393 RepID=UPI0031D549AD
MIASQLTNRLMWLFVIIVTFAASWFLTFRYFPFEPDVANSPLVWRAFLDEGFSVLRDWKPTPDNWYFTVYPINFLFYTLFSSDDRFVLTLSTLFFVFLTPLIVAAITQSTQRKITAFIAPMLIVLLPAYCYIYGFIAHPFSHYSTNFYGVVIFALSFYNLKKKSTAITALYSLLSLLTAVSDPWFSATWFLPLLLVHGYFSWQNIISKKTTIIYLLTFIFTMIQAVPRWLHIPVQHFKLVPMDQWLGNAEWAVHILGRSLNLFFIDNDIAYFTSLAIWVAVFLRAAVVCWQLGEKARFIALFSFLSIAAIITSFVIGYDMASEGSARFFLNVFCCLVMVVTLYLGAKKNVVLSGILALFVASSCYSYTQNPGPYADDEAQTRAYITFLNQNNLSFGYGDFWKWSNNVNWLSENKIHITPVIWEDDYKIMFSSSRGQTMRSWLETEFVARSPERQFVAIPAIATNDDSGDANRRLEAIRQQFGTPDEVLTFSGMTIFVYNHRLPIN